MAEVTIEIRNNGPYRIYGDVSLVDHEGNPVPVPEGKRKTSPEGKSWISLCRCGGSVTKPFCDGAHSRIGFIGAQEAVEKTERSQPPADLGIRKRAFETVHALPQTCQARS